MGSDQLNGLALKPFVMERFVSFRNVFVNGQANVAHFDRLKGRLDRRMRRQAQHQNTDHLLATSRDGLFLSAAQVFITQAARPGDRGFDPREELLSEDPHTDGSAGMLHFGFSHFGRRALRCWTAAGQLAFEQKPGSFYLSNTTAFKHQAVHLGTDSPADVCDFGRLAGCSVSVMLRSTFFPGYPARLANREPSPVGAYRAASEIIATWLQEHADKLVVPTLQQVREEHERRLAPASRSSSPT